MDQNGFKTRLSRIFQGSMKSCRARNLSDVVETADLIPQNPHQKPFPPPSPPPLPYNINAFPSLCKPRYCCNEKGRPRIVNNSIIPRKKLYSFLAEEGFACPPVSPLSPQFYEKEKHAYKKKKRRSHRKKIAQQVKKRSQEASLFRSSSQDSAYYYNWFSSDEEEEKGGESQEEEENDSIFFSSRSNTLSSDSSGVVTSKRHRLRRRRRASPSSYTNSHCSSSSSVCNNNNNVNVMPLIGDRLSVKDSFAVVKSSRDPYNDFRTSMLEMIIEKQIFGAKELEQLLQCFLSLNSEHHHRIIFEVFNEIWEALFSG